MHIVHHHHRGPGLMPLRGGFCRPHCASRLKIRARRHERRTARIEIKGWLNELLPELASE